MGFRTLSELSREWGMPPGEVRAAVIGAGWAGADVGISQIGNATVVSVEDMRRLAPLFETLQVSKRRTRPNGEPSAA